MKIAKDTHGAKTNKGNLYVYIKHISRMLDKITGLQIMLNAR